MILADEWAGWRDPFTGEPNNDNASEWTEWDFLLVQAYQTIEAYTDSNGIRKWQKDDPEERISALRKIDPYQAEIDRITRKKNYKPDPGEFFVPDLKTGREDGKFWTYTEWMDSILKDSTVE